MAPVAGATKASAATVARRGRATLYSLRETAVLAGVTGLAWISDVALLKRFKGAGAWFLKRSVERPLLNIPPEI
jgi:hypothetical protein